MNRLLRIIFFCLAALLALYAALFANYLHADGEPVWRSKTIWLTLAGVIFFCAAGWRFSLQSKFKLFAVLLSLLAVELFLQAAAWLGVLPGLDTKDKAPFARVYWRSEGHGNSVRNRFGWHFPEFDLKAPKRVAVIGDSFVEAVEVGRNENEAVRLQQLLRAQSPDWSVLGLGTRGTSPAHYMDVLDYAQRHFAPQEAIVMIYLGNDINETSPKLNVSYLPPERFVYYDLDSGGGLVLNPASAGKKEQFDRGLEFSHGPLLGSLAVTLKSHFLTLQMLNSLRGNLGLRSLTRKLAAENPETAKYGRIGLSLKPYAVKPDPDAQYALSVMLAELAVMKQRCDANHCKLRLVTIPFFPPQFYSAQSGGTWSAKLGEYDFLAPDRQIAAFAQAQGIPFLSFADWLASKKTDVAGIRGLYFGNGSGHFTEHGHALCARAMFDTFYARP
jgi:hypothetical protein